MNQDRLHQLEAENSMLKAKIADQQMHIIETGEKLTRKLVAVLGYIRLLIKKQNNIDTELLGEILTIAEKDCTEALPLVSELRKGTIGPKK